MGLQRSISNLSKASFSTYFYVFDSLLCDCREALFGHNDYYLFARHKSDTYCSLCTYVFFPSCSFFTFFYCQCLLFKESCLNPHLFLPLHILLYYWLRCTLCCTWKNLQRNNDFFFSEPFVFVCLLQQWNLIHLGHFLFVWVR